MVRVTLSPLVPKPHTPFAGRAMMSPAEVRRRVRGARKGLSGIPGVRVSTPSVREADLEFRIGTGDASLFEWLVERAMGS
jgi:hypothetical protein